MKEMKMKSMSCCVMTLAMVFAMFVLTSCMTKKILTEQVVVHDTLRECHTDTMRLFTHHSHTDTVRESRVQVVTLRQDSARTDTVRVETMHEKWHIVYVNDTVNTFRHLADSLQKMIEREEMKKVTVTKRRHIGTWCIITLLALAVVVVFFIIVLRKSGFGVKGS